MMSDSDQIRRMNQEAHRVFTERMKEYESVKRNGQSRIWMMIALIITCMLTLGGGVVNNYASISGIERQLQMLVVGQSKQNDKLDRLIERSIGKPKGD